MNNETISKNKYFLITVLLVFAIGTGILGYLQYKNSIAPASVVPVSAIPTSPPEVWQTYTNSQLGFSIEYPQMVTGIYRCSPYKDFWVPVKVFEDNASGITYIAQEHYYEASYSSDLNDYIGPCEKNTYSLEALKKERQNYGPFLAWAINIKNINNDAELAKFIKDNYGPSCFVKDKKTGNQDGVYDITIEGIDWAKNGDPEPVMTCGWNYQYKILYAPEKNKIMSARLGQDCLFQNNPTAKSYVCADDRMIDSFKFE